MRYSSISFAVLAALACSAANAEVIKDLKWNVTGEYQLPTPEALKDGVQAYVASGETKTLSGTTGAAITSQPGRWANVFLAQGANSAKGVLNVQNFDSIDIHVTYDKKVYENETTFADNSKPHISGQKGVNIIHATSGSSVKGTSIK